MQTYSEALDLLTRNVQAQRDPVISDPELDSLLADAARLTIIDPQAEAPGVWVADTDFNVGAVVQPTRRNGHRYRLINVADPTVQGHSGLSEPIWPLSADSRILDGDNDAAVTWIEWGPDYDSAWDIDLASYNGWMLKASKVAACFDYKSDRDSYLLSQKYDHFVKMAQSFSPIAMA